MESKVRITQNKRKERENLPKIEEITGGKAHVNTRKLNQNISTITDVFLNQKRINVRENTVKMAPRDLEPIIQAISAPCSRSSRSTTLNLYYGMPNWFHPR